MSIDCHKPLDSLAVDPATSIPILMYHQIDISAPMRSPFRYLTVSPKNFYRQMNWLKRVGYIGLSMRDLQPYLSGDKTGKVVGITFDDGFHNVYAHALPVLQSVGFTATNYCVSNQIDGYNAWDMDIGVVYSACMSKTELREWAALGHEVGAHTCDHVHLTRVSKSEAWRQIHDGRRQLEDLIGQTVDAFAYPYGDVSEAIVTLVEQAEFNTAATTKRGRVGRNDQRLLLPRKTVKRTDGSLKFLHKCVTN